MKHNKYAMINFFAITLLVFTGGIFSLKFNSLKLDNNLKLYTLIGLFLLIIHSAYLLFSYSISKYEECNSSLLMFFISLFLSYEFLKEKILLGNKIDELPFLVINICTIIILFLGYIALTKVKIKNKIEELSPFYPNTLIELKNLIILSVPFYLFSCEGIGTKYIFLLLGIYYIMIERKKLLSYNKKSAIFVGLFILLALLSYILNRKLALFSDTKKVIIAFFIFLSFLQMNLDKKLLKKFYLIAIISMLEPAVTIINRFISSGFNYKIRYWTNDYPASVSIFATLIFFFILFHKKYYLIPLFLIIIASAILEGSRGALLSIIINFFIIIIFKYKKHLKTMLLMTSIVLCISAFILNFTVADKQFSEKEIKSGMTARKDIWEESIYQIKNKPIFGNGIKTLGSTLSFRTSKDANIINKKEELYKTEESHNNLLESMRSLGIFGTIMYILFNIYIFISSIIRYRKKRNFTFLLPILMLISMETIGTTNGTMLDGSKSNLLFLTILAIIFNIYETKESHE